ncbi:hypothetical protein OBK22_04280 [Empedobacter falsenii]
MNKILLFLIPITIFSQKPFEDLGNYKKLGLQFTPTVYSKAISKPTIGNRTIEGLNTFSYKFGLVYTINPKDKISARIGLSTESIPSYKIIHEIKKGDVPKEFEWLEGEEQTKSWKNFSYLNIPITAEYKIRLNDKFILSFGLGTELMFYKSTFIEYVYSYTDETKNERTEIFGLRLNNDKNTSFTPTLRLSPSIYWKNKITLIQLGLIYKNDFRNYLEGEYIYDNLENNPTSRGKVKIPGDYIGLELNVFLKKSKKRLK